MENNEVIKEQLENNERLFWSGQPAQGVKITGSDAFLIPFSLLWGGFAIFWEAPVISSGAPFFFMLFGIPFVLIGLYLIIGRFFIDAKQRQNTFYGITDKRVIIASGLFNQSTNSIYLDSISEMSVSTKASGSGTITFGRQNPMYSMFNSVSWPGLSKHAVPSFYLIPDVKTVNKIIRENQEKLKS